MKVGNRYIVMCDDLEDLQFVFLIVAHIKNEQGDEAWIGIKNNISPKREDHQSARIFNPVLAFDKDGEAKDSYGDRWYVDGHRYGLGRSRAKPRWLLQPEPPPPPPHDVSRGTEKP